tara:strand:- start:1127 stop:1957 length:831 start_codon:yes stop_codon:yes gene_type:complete
MSDDDNQQTQEQPAEAPAPDGLMAQAALAQEEQENVEDEGISHLAQDTEQAAGEDEDEIYERPDWFPAKHWDEKEGPDLEGLVKSNLELEKKFHHGDHKPPADGQYNTDVLTEAGYELDDPVVSTYLEWAQKYGINQEAFSELAGSIGSIAGEAGQQMALDLKAEHQKLGSNADAIIKSNMEWSNGLLTKGVISEEEREELDMWGGSAAGQRLLQKVRSMTGDLSKIPIADVTEAGESEDEFKARMLSLMSEPDYASDRKKQLVVESEYNKRYGTS